MTVTCIGRPNARSAIYAADGQDFFVRVEHALEGEVWNLVTCQRVVTFAIPLNQNHVRIGKPEKFYSSSFDRVAAHVFGDVDQLVTHKV